MAKKKVAAVVKIQIPAGQATPGPAGRHRARPARRGDHGLLQGVQRADRGPAGHDRPGRDHGLRGPLASRSSPRPRRRRCSCGRPPGSRRARQTPGREAVGSVTTAQVEEIAQIKMPDLNANDLEAAKLQVAGTARSMGIEVGLTRPPQPTRSQRRPAREDLARAAVTTRRGSRHGEGQEVHRRDQAVRPRPPPHAGRGGRPGEEPGQRPSSTRPSSWPCASASIPARPTRWCAAPSPCPSGTGKDVRVAVFAAGDAAAEARAAGADIVGADDLVAQVEGGMLDFDVAIATPDLMPLVGQLGRVLGPRGLMPNPKTGTVTTDVGKAVDGVQGRQGRVPHRPLRQRARAGRQGQLRAATP